MKNLQLLFVVVLLIFASCEEEQMCDCEYISYDDGVETYRSSWDASCEDEVLSTSTFTFSDGTKVNTKTVIKCR